jgi:hypothetical protein
MKGNPMRMMLIAAIAALSVGCFDCENSNAFKSLKYEIATLREEKEFFAKKSLDHLAEIELLRGKVMEHSAARVVAEKKFIDCELKRLRKTGTCTECGT